MKRIVFISKKLPDYWLSIFIRPNLNLSISYLGTGSAWVSVFFHILLAVGLNSSQFIEQTTQLIMMTDNLMLFPLVIVVVSKKASVVRSA